MNGYICLLCNVMVLNFYVLLFRDLDRGIVGVVHYNGFCFGIRLFLGMSLEELKRLVCERWSDINPLCLEMYVSRDEKEFILGGDDEIQCMVCFAVVKGLENIDIFVRRMEGSKLLTSDDQCASSSSGSVSCVDETEGHEPRNCNAWANAITGVGQRFSGGAVEFRTSLQKFSIQHGFKFEFKKNCKDRITVVCSKRYELGCQWRIHASQKFKLARFFEIKEMVKEHTCGVGFKDLRKPPMTSQLVKSVIFGLVRDKPLVKPSEIIDYFRRECGVRLSYYFAYTGRGIAIKEIHGDDSVSYKQLAWYTESIRRTNPGSYVTLEVDEESRKFKRIFISFEACIYGFNFCRPLLCLDGCHLKAKFKGCMLSATATNGDGGMFMINFFFYIEFPNIFLK